MREPVRADHPREPDVDHLALGRCVRGVEGDQRHDPRDQQATRRHGQQPVPPLQRPKAGEQHAQEDVGEHRIDKSHREPDLGLVEEEERDAEAEQRQQVEMDQPQRSSRIDERREKEHAERQPDPPAVHLAGDGPLVAAGELRIDLGSGPLLHHVSRRVVDDDLGDVMAVGLVVVDLPLVPAVVAEPRANPYPLRPAGQLPTHRRGRNAGDALRIQAEPGWRLGLGGGNRQLVGPAPVERRLVGGVGRNCAAPERSRRSHGDAGQSDQRGQRQPHPARLHSQWLPDSDPARRRQAADRPLNRASEWRSPAHTP